MNFMQEKNNRIKICRRVFEISVENGGNITKKMEEKEIKLIENIDGKCTKVLEK